MPIISSTKQGANMWSSWCLASAFRTALACTIVGLTTLYGPSSIIHQVAFPAFSYVTVILIVTDATLGDTLEGCWLALYASAQSLGPAMLSLWLIGPAQFTCSTISVAVGLAAFVVALPGSTHVVAKRIALGQIVIVYVVGYINGVQLDQALMHPLHVAASTAIGVVACVVALLVPYPRLARWEVKQNCDLLAENVSERLELLAKAFSAEDEALTFASISQTKPMAIAGAKFLQNIKRYQGSMRWERLPWKILSPCYYTNPGDRFQEIETPLRGMELALTSTSSFPTKYQDEKTQKNLFQSVKEITLNIKQLDNIVPGGNKLTIPEPNPEIPINSLDTIQAIIIIPTSHQDLPSLFFLFCMKLLHYKSLENCPTTIFSKKENDHPPLSLPPTKQEIKISTGFLSINWANLRRNTMSTRRLMPALKCSLSLGLAILFGLIYSKPNGYWSGLPVAISLVTSREATFKVANVKAQGTVLGTIYGVLGCFLFEKFLPVRFLSLIPWFIVTNLLRKSKMYGQAGGISAVIGAVLILGRKNFGMPSEFAIARITETFIGLTCSIVVELLLQPTRASNLAKVQLTKCLGTLCTCMEYINLGANIEKTNLSQAKNRLRLDVGELGKFIEEAEVEPNFWFLPFPGACYSKLFGSLSKMVDLLDFSHDALGFLKQESENFGGDSWKDYTTKLDGDLELFRDMVGTLINYFKDVTSLKSLTFLNKGIEDKNLSCDLELGKSSSKKNIFRVPGSDQDGIMESLISSYMQHFKEVVERLEEEKEEEGEGEVKNQVVLSLGALGFCLSNLIKEAREIEKAIYELVQRENPSELINLYEISCKIHVLYN